MSSDLPDHLKAEQAAVEADIRAAFKGVTRDSGVSWSQAALIDPGGDVDPRALAEALTRDVDLSWEELVDDPTWLHDFGVGGFPFLDPIGTRYYLAPAMIREARQVPGNVASVLTVDNDDRRHGVSLLTPLQCAAVARFCRYMMAVCHSQRLKDADSGADYFAWVWQTAYESHWKRFEAARE
jgi:hypothetical protein